MLSIRAWCDKAKPLAYGVLRLRPWEFEKLSLMDFHDMLNAADEAKISERWEKSYWVATIISPHLKHGAKAEDIMKPFLKQKTKEEKIKETEAFFENFYRLRKEAEDEQKRNFRKD